MTTLWKVISDLSEPPD